MTGPKFFVGRSDRLIARLKDFLWAWRFADQVGGQLFYLWPQLPERYGEECEGYSPGKIFDLLEFYRTGGADRLVFVECDRIALPEKGIALDTPEFEQSRAHGFDRDFFRSSDAAFVQRGSADARFSAFWFSDEPDTGRHRLADVRRLFPQLPIHPKLVQVMDAFKARNGIEEGNYGAVHVRRGDCYTMIQNALCEGDRAEHLELFVKHFVVRTAPTEFYRPEVEKMIAAGQKMIFTSDTPGVIDEFRKAFGAKHFIDLGMLRAPSMIEKAFADFLMLYGANELVGTGSNFARFAAQLRGAPFVNVCVTGEFEVARTAFERDVVGDRAADPALLAQAYGYLEQLYAAHIVKRRQAAQIGEMFSTTA